MRDALYLAWRYVAHNRGKSLVLLASITIILYVPGGLRALVRQGEEQLTARAEATPILVGKKGSPVELVLSSLYFAAEVPETLRYEEVARIRETGFADAIPLYVRFRAQGDPIVGTSFDYFRWRGLRVERGLPISQLGDCVVGAHVALRRGVGPGDAIVSSPENLFDLAGIYPLKMRVTGVLAPTGGADDDALFVDVRTAWVIEGLAHGHDELQSGEILERSEGNLVANASVVQYNEITDENVGSFHFHGEDAGFPITAILAAPRDEKAATLLIGRYQSPDELHQVLRPVAVVDELLATVLTVQAFVVAAVALVGLGTLATSALVFVLSLRLRRREIETLVRIGAARGRVASVLVYEVAGVLLASALLAMLSTWLTARFGGELVRGLLR